MSDAWKDFEEQARLARQESAPRVDVTHRVLARIATSSARTGDAGQRPMLLCAAGALLAASVVAIVASSSWIALNDPLSDLAAGLAVLNP